jgi:hypothetical protein
MAGLGLQEELLAAVWLTGLRSPQTCGGGWPAGPGRGGFHRAAAAVGAVELNLTPDELTGVTTKPRPTTPAVGHPAELNTENGQLN